MLALAQKAQKSEFHLLHQTFTERPQRKRHKSRRPFATHAQELLGNTPADTSRASWVKAKWKEEWRAAAPSRLHRYIEDPTDVPGEHLPRGQWTTLNRLRTGVGRFGESMQRWGLVDSAHCDCGDPLQTVDHILTSCSKHRPPNGDLGLKNLDKETLEWLATTELRI